jgi:putative ABC transport system permease protein
MDTIDIGMPEMGVLFGVVALPWLLIYLLRLELWKDVGIAIVRMAAQLTLVGFYLKTLFVLNNPWLNGLWILVMLVVADLAILRRAGLRPRLFFLSTFAAVTLSITYSMSYLMLLVIKPPILYDARYLVPMAGMLLGNCLTGNVIGLERFYAALKKSEGEYLTYLLLGATRSEAIAPYFREAVKAAINPTVAGMATMGLVSLPGMMTGQILGGSEPWLAVKYQIAIMLCIFASTLLAVFINLKLSIARAFDEMDVLREDVSDAR